jgi:hypothetical protein
MADTVSAAEDFEPRADAAIIEQALHEHEQAMKNPEEDAVRAAVLYDATSMFECAVAATLRADRVAAIASDTALVNYESIKDKLIATKPHQIIFLNDKWPREFCASMTDATAPPSESSEDATTNHAIVVILTPTKIAITPEERASLPEDLLFMSPRLFSRFAPVEKVVSAQIVFAHMMHGEFPIEFADNEKAVCNGQFFRLALRANTNSTLDSFAFIREIVSDWRKVYEPDELVAFGHALSVMGSKTARARVETQSARLVIRDIPECTRAILIESPEYVEATIAAALRDPKTHAAIVYSLSPDTARCIVTCGAATGELARNVCASIAQEGARIDMVSDTVCHITCPTDGFFAKIRALIERPRITPDIAETIAAGEKVLAVCGKHE